ncbi:Protein OSCP1-like [Aphelenchoides bicaudatus]|nr:Protein OSCP1-like [Aphelenchoides bicaudatus]
MPFVFLNMTGELAYILEQRLIVSIVLSHLALFTINFEQLDQISRQASLQAQRITEAKCRKVLYDILKVVFNKRFMKKLFTNQEQYSRSSLRQYFEKMAHSSVMRLNEPRRSMERLFDMLTMAVKFQITAITDPRQMIEVTINHLRGLLRIAAYDEELVDSIMMFHNRLVEKYKDTSMYEYGLIRTSIINHMKASAPIKVRVSQLMRMNYQRSDGHFILNRPTILLPYGLTEPGTIRYYEKGQLCRITSIEIDDKVIINDKMVCTDILDIKNRSTDLGDNIFMEPEEKKPGPPKIYPTATQEANFLKALLNREDPKDSEHFTLNLFEDEEKPAAAARPETSSSLKTAVKRPSSKQRNTTTSSSDTKANVKVRTSKSLAGRMQEMELKTTTAPKKTRGEQLLNMMDDVEAKQATKPTTSKITRSRSTSQKVIRNKSAIGQKK